MPGPRCSATASFPLLVTPVGASDPLRAEGRALDAHALEQIRRVVDYLKEFPQRLHHPKEEAYLHRLLRLRHPEGYPLLDEQEADWAEIANAFESNEDARIDDITTAEFDCLFARIVNLTMRRWTLTTSEPKTVTLSGPRWPRQGATQKPSPAPAPNSVAKPSSAKMPAAMECTSFIGILPASRSPANTAGTSAISIPKVVPATTHNGEA